MISDTDRREVARRLRELRGGWSSGECYYTIIHALGLPDTSREDGGAALYARLADLIEPSCDRDDLLEEVKELEKCAGYFGLDFDEDEPLRDRLKEAAEDFAGCASRIREALRVAE